MKRIGIIFLLFLSQSTFTQNPSLEITMHEHLNVQGLSSFSKGLLIQFTVPFSNPYSQDPALQFALKITLEESDSLFITEQSFMIRFRYQNSTLIPFNVHCQAPSYSLERNKDTPILPNHEDPIDQIQSISLLPYSSSLTIFDCFHSETILQPDFGFKNRYSFYLIFLDIIPPSVQKWSITAGSFKESSKRPRNYPIEIGKYPGAFVVQAKATITVPL